jgi:hypothetical protein
MNIVKGQYEPTGQAEIEGRELDWLRPALTESRQRPHLQVLIVALWKLFEVFFMRRERPRPIFVLPDEVIKRYGALPLAHQPGEQWLYNSGSDIMGIMIARSDHAGAEGEVVPLLPGFWENGVGPYWEAPPA